MIELYSKLLKEQDMISIRRKHEDDGNFYFEFMDVTYIKVEIDNTRRMYSCEVLDPDNNFKGVLYPFILSYDYVIEIGTFEEALTRIYNNVIKPIITKMYMKGDNHGSS